ncbi:MAG: 6-phosphogluconolactonase [Spirochaetaceae bacterium]
MNLKSNKNIKIESFQELKLLSKQLLNELKPGNIALSGGSTYLQLLKLWSHEELDLKNINFYPVDERVVDFESPDSNWGNTYRNFLKKYDKNRKNHFIDGVKYNQYLEDISLNTIFLGVGDDGHTASLFSSEMVFSDNNLKVIETLSPKAPIKRVSLTGNYIISADNIIIIFYGDGKKDIVNKVLQGNDLPITTLLNRVKRGIIYIHKPLLGDIDE